MSIKPVATIWHIYVSMCEYDDNVVFIARPTLIVWRGEGFTNLCVLARIRESKKNKKRKSCEKYKNNNFNVFYLFRSHFIWIFVFWIFYKFIALQIRNTVFLCCCFVLLNRDCIIDNWLEYKLNYGKSLFLNPNMKIYVRTLLCRTGN